MSKREIEELAGSMGYTTPRWDVAFNGSQRTLLSVSVGLAGPYGEVYPIEMRVHEVEALIDTLTQMKWLMEQANGDTENR